MVKSQQQNIISHTKNIRQFLLIVTALAFLFFLFVANPSKYYFLNDDFEHILLAGGGHFIFGTLLRPVGDISLWFDNNIWGKNAFGYHLTNTIIHIGNTLLVFLLARLFFYLYGKRENIYLKSWAVSILFLVYAFHSEPVFWVICRSGSISTFFFLLSCICYLKRHGSPSYFLFSLLLFGIGLLTYESIWIYPFVVFFISMVDIGLKKIKWKKEWAYPFITGVFFAVYLVYIKLNTGNIGNDYTMYNFFHFNPVHLFYNYNTLLARCLLPYMASAKWFLSLYITAIIFIIGAVWMIIKKKKTSILLWLLIGCFLISPLPEISLGIDTHTSESERYIYLPSVFCILLLIEIVFTLVTNIKSLICIQLFLLILNSYFLFQSASAYRFAGLVIKQSLNAINTSSLINTIHVINRPIQYKGAIMFRSDFGDALRWMCYKCRYEKIDTLSSYKYLKIPGSFSVKELNFDEGVRAIHAISVVDKKTDSLQIYVQGISFSFVPSKDMILYWNDSTLIKIK